MKRHPSVLGYTLTEAMMVVTIIGIIASIAPTMIIQIQNFYLSAVARYEVQRDARTSLDLICQELRQAKNSTVQISAYNASQGPFSQIAFTKIDNSNITIYQNGNQLVLKRNGQTSILSRNLAFVTFVPLDTHNPSVLHIGIAMSKTIQRGQRVVLEMYTNKGSVMN